MLQKQLDQAQNQQDRVGMCGLDWTLFVPNWSWVVEPDLSKYSPMKGKLIEFAALTVPPLGTRLLEAG